jgi:hypothetical protein
VSNCRSGCATQDHSSYTDCLRQSGIRVSYTNSANGWDKTKQDKWDGELQRFRNLEAQGINPIGTTHREMDRTEIAQENKQAIQESLTTGSYE